MNYPENSPFQLLKPYEADDYPRFFGRDIEIRQLADALRQSKFILLYGASGTGKTSLIQCGLPRMFSPRDWMPIFVRRGNAGFLKSIRDRLQEKHDEYYIDSVPPNTEHLSLRELVKAVFDLTFVPVYLILDQFEEVFTIGDAKEQAAFFEEINALGLFKNDLFCKLLIVVREEYIAHFYGFEKQYSFIFEHRFRVEKMREAQLIEVVQKTLEFKYFEHLPVFSIDPMASAKIVDNISDEHKELDLTTLQVYLDRLYREDLIRMSVKPEEMRPVRFDMELVGQNKIDDVLSVFLNEQTNLIHEDLKKGHEIELKGAENFPMEVLYSLVTKEKTKRSCTAQEIYNNIKTKEYLNASLLLVQDCLEALEKPNCRILSRLDLAKTAEISYELAHDRLAEQVAKMVSPNEQRYQVAIETLNRKCDEYSKSGLGKGEYLSLGELDLIKKWVKLDRLKKELKEYYEESEQDHQRQRSRRLWLTWGAVVAAVVFAMVAVFAYWQKQKVQLNETYYRGLVRTQTDPTDGLKTIMEVLRNEPSDTTKRRSAYDIYATNLFYNLLGIEKDSLIKPIDFSANGEMFAIASGGGVKLYRTKGPALIDSTGFLANSVNCLVFKGNDTLFVAGSNRTLYLYKISNDKNAALYLFDTIITDVPVSSISFSRNGLFFCTTFDNTEYATAWDNNTMTLSRTINSESGAISASALSPDGRWIVTGTANGQLSITAIGSNWANTIKRIYETQVNTIDFSPDGKTIIAGFVDGMIRRWVKVQALGGAIQEQDFILEDSSSFVIAGSVKVSVSPIKHLTFSADSRLYLSISEDGNAAVFNTKTSQTDFKLLAGEYKLPYMAAKFTENQEAIYTTDNDGQIRHWDFANPFPLSINMNVVGKARVWFTPDGKKLVVANSRGTIPYFEVYETGQYKKIGLPTPFSNEIKQLFMLDGWMDIPAMLEFNEESFQASDSTEETGILEWLDEGSSYIFMKENDSYLNLRTREGFFRQVFQYEIDCCITDVSYQGGIGHLAAVTNSGYLLIWRVRPDYIREGALK